MMLVIVFVYVHDNAIWYIPTAWNSACVASLEGKRNYENMELGAGCSKGAVRRKTPFW